MKIDAVGVTTTNMEKTIKFYTILGFDFSGIDIDADHVEPKVTDGSARLMIDHINVVRDIINVEPKPGNHSPFAIYYNSNTEIDNVISGLKAGGFTVEKEPWKASWGQYYSVVKDPDGYKIDLYTDI